MKYSILLSALSIALLASCSSGSMDPEELVCTTLNEGDSVEWVVKLPRIELDSNRIVYIAQSNDTMDCHLCGPAAALVLLKRPSARESWVVNDFKKRIPVISQWGQLPKFRLVRLPHRNVLVTEYGYGNQGSYQSNFAVFDLDYCEFGNSVFNYTYQAEIDSYMFLPQAMGYEPNLPASIEDWPYKYLLQMELAFDTVSSDLNLKSTQREIKFIHPTDDRQTWVVNLPPIAEAYTPMLCTWGNRATRP